MRDYFIVWSHIFAYFNFYFIYLVVKHPVIAYNITFFNPKFDASPFDSIWLEISIDWYTKSQGPKKKSIHLTIGRIDPCSDNTARD